VMPGDVYGFLGQNGAGKSTTIRMLLSLVRPSSGEIQLFGLNLKRHRKEILKQVGAVIESPDLYTFLSGYENLEIFAGLSGRRIGRSDIMDKLELVGLADRCRDKVKTYSQGMKQRLGIATALIHDPSLVILDEPTNGLDPQGIADIRKLIRSLSSERGKTIIVSSHLLAEVEQVATRLLIIDRGVKIAEGPIRELLDPEHVSLELDTTDNASCRAYLMGSGRWSPMLAASSTTLRLHLKREEVPQLAQELSAHGFGIQALTPRNALEAYFLSLTQNPNHVDAGQD
jgi:ABC-2 type transport system ATP-binding protein